MFIRRFPPAHEQSMWPDTLPATMTVPAGFTLYPPANLDLSETDLTVHGAVMLPPAPPAAASETEAGLVELATEAEAIAGTDTERAVTPAGVAAVVSLIPTAPEVDFDEVEFTELGTGSGLGWCVLCTFKKNGIPITARARAMIGLAPLYQGSGMEFTISTGGNTYSIYGYLSSRQFKVAGHLSGSGDTDIGAAWGWVNGTGGSDGQAVAKASGNSNPYSSIPFGLIVIRSDGAEFESGTFQLPQGQ